MNTENLNGEYKFNNCKHRSLDQKTVTIKRCSCQGGDYKDSGYECTARSIFKINSEICQYCWAFEDKNEQNKK